MPEANKSQWIAYTDGASRGNPGHASIGVFVTSPQGQEYNFNKYIGIKTNNQAEYAAVVLALRELTKLKAQNILIRADSELMVKQMNGIYKVKNENIIPLYKEILTLLPEFKSYQFEHVRREFNKVADRLANEAIDQFLASSF